MTQQNRASRAALLLVLLAGCADAPPPSTVTTLIDTVNRTVRIRNQGEPPRWQLRELLTLGSADEATANPQQFTTITGVIADAQHNIYVADSRAWEIRVFNEQGELLRRFGRRGSGPREFGSLQSIAWLGDTLLVMDAGNNRLGLMNGAGEWLGQRVFSNITGNVRLYQTRPREVYSVAVRRGNNTVFRSYVRQTPAGEADTLVVPATSTPFRAVVCNRSDGGISFYTSTYAQSAATLPAPGSLLMNYGGSGDYRVNFLKPPDTLRIIERDLPRIPVTNDEWSEEERKFRSWLDSLPVSHSCQPSGPERPDAKQMLRAVYFDDQNRTWIEHRAGNGYAFDVFDQDGRLIAQMVAPPRLERVPVYVRGDRLYLVATDSLDVQYVKAYQITR